MGADMHYREDDLLRRKGQAINGRPYVVLVETPRGDYMVDGPFSRGEARKHAEQIENPTLIRKMRGPLVALIEDNQP